MCEPTIWHQDRLQLLIGSRIKDVTVPNLINSMGWSQLSCRMLNFQFYEFDVFFGSLDCIITVYMQLRAYQIDKASS